MKVIWFRAALAAALLVAAAPALAAGNPTKLEVKLFRTELFDGAAWVTVFSSDAGTAIDLVGNVGGVFGKGEVPVGTYSRVRFTVANQVRFSAGAVDACGAATDATFLVKPGLAADAQRPLVFATAAQGGGASGWTPNGTDDDPFLMAEAIEVRENVTTKLTLQFDTADSVTCDGTTLAVAAPKMHAFGVVVPVTAPFQGGEFWIAHYNAARFGDPALLGGTAADRASYRASAGYFLGWGAKARFRTPDVDGVGVLSVQSGMTENRRQLDETYCSDCGVATGAATMDLVYVVEANGRVTFTFPGGGTIRGAFNPDFSLFVGMAFEAGSSDQDLIVGVRASGAQSLTGVYGIASLNQEFSYPTTAGAAPIASSLFGAHMIGWGRFDGATGTNVCLYQSKLNLAYPADTFDATTNPFSWNAELMYAAGALMPASLDVDATGQGSLVLNGTQWIAAAPGGHLALTVGDTAAMDHDPSADVAKFLQSFGLLLKQAPAGTHTPPALAGKWTVFNRTDDMKSYGSDAALFKGGEYGTITLDLLGNLTFDVTRSNDLGFSAGTGSGTFAIRQACFGAPAGEGTTRLDWTDAACTDGQKLDVGVITAKDNAGVSKEVAWMLFSDDGTAATLVSAEGFDASAVAAGYKTLGFLVRAH